MDSRRDSHRMSNPDNGNDKQNTENDVDVNDESVRGKWEDLSVSAFVSSLVFVLRSSFADYFVFLAWF